MMVLQYLRDLPPILTYENYTCFIAVHGIPQRVERIKSAQFDQEEYLKKIKEIFNMLPKLNQELLKYVLDFLYDVSQHEKKNCMGLKNISIIFAPLLLRSTEKESLELVSEMSIVQDICEYLIINRNRVCI